MDDSEIVELYLSRDESAIACTAEKYGAHLRRIAENILADAALAEECENDAYLAAWRLIPPNEPRTYLFAFLGKITRHIAIDRLRKDEGGRELFCELSAEMAECIPGGGDVEGEVEAEALARSVSLFLSRCPEKQRNVFVRRYWFFDTVAEICERYGLSQSSVKTMLFRMRERLRRHLEKEGYTI